MGRGASELCQDTTPKAKGYVPAPQSVVSVRGKTDVTPLLPQVNSVRSDHYQTRKRQPRERPVESIAKYLTKCEDVAASNERHLLRYDRSKLEQLISGGFLTTRQRQRAQCLLAIIDSLPS